MGNKERAPNQTSQGGGHSFKRSRCPIVGSNFWVDVLQEWMVVLHVVMSMFNVGEGSSSIVEG